jgi:hypothetical protein
MMTDGKCMKGFVGPIYHMLSLSHFGNGIMVVVVGYCPRYSIVCSCGCGLLLLTA